MEKELTAAVTTQEPMLADRLIVVQQLPVIKEQLHSIKAQAQASVAEALALVCTEETLKAVKDRRAALTRDRKDLDARRMVVKNQIMQPFEDFDKKEFIDTGLKLFETVNDSMELTLLATFSVAAGTYNGSSPAALFDCFSNSSNDQRGVFGCTWGNGNFGVNVYQSSGASNTLVDDTKLQLAIQIKGGKYRMTQDGTFGAWSSISNYGTGKTVSKSLLIGAAWGDGTEKKFYFGGTVYDFQVYGKVLTDAQVKALLAAGLGDTTDTPSSTLPTPRYKLEAQKTFVPANKECIDTGIKPFATIDTGMNLTVYATFTVADSAVNTVTTLLDCFTDSTDDRRGIIVATWTNGTVGVNVFTYASHFVKIESGKKMKFLLQIKGTQFRFLSYGSMTEWKNIPNYAANKTVEHPLLLGAGWGDGTTKDRFFNGTVYDFRVFDTALTDAQITTLMEAN